MVRLLSVALAGVLAQLRLSRDALSRTRRHYAPSDTACEVFADVAASERARVGQDANECGMTEKMQRNGAPRDML